MSAVTVSSDERSSQDSNVIRNAFDIKHAVECDNHDVFGYCINHRHVAGDDESSENEESSDTASSDEKDVLSESGDSRDARLGHEKDGADDEPREQQREAGAQRNVPMTCARFHDIFDKWLAQEGREAPCWSSGSTFYWHYVSLNLPHFRARVRVNMFHRTLEFINEENTCIELPLHEPRFGMDEVTFEQVKSMPLLQYLHDHCSEPSPFGNVRTVSTQTDTSVRKARQLSLDASSVDADFLKTIRKCWAEQMYPAKVRVEPYKLNLYDADGLFKPHKDTPADQLIGTFLVGLGYTNKRAAKAVHLKIHAEAEEPHDWKCHGGDWCAMYSDVVHEVVPFAAGGLRGTLAFKVYATETNNECDSIIAECEKGFVSEEGGDNEIVTAPSVSKRPKLAELLPESENIVIQLDAAIPSATARQMHAQEHEQLLNKLNNVKRPFGFLLSHEYSMGFTTLKGIDARLKKTLEHLDDVELAIFPVVTRINKDWDYDEDATWETSVAAFSSGHVDRILGRPQQAKNAAQLAQLDALMDHVAEAGKIPMVVFSEKSFDGVWSKHSQEAGVTGNEACPGSEHSIYLQAALVVLEKK